MDQKGSLLFIKLVISNFQLDRSFIDLSIESPATPIHIPLF